MSATSRSAHRTAIGLALLTAATLMLGACVVPPPVAPATTAPATTAPTPTARPTPLPSFGPFIPVGDPIERDKGRLTERVRSCVPGASKPIVKNPLQSVSAAHNLEWSVAGTTGVGTTIGNDVFPVKVELSASMEASFGESFNQTEVHGTGWELPADPGTIVTYILQWSELWQPGYIEARFFGQPVVRIDVLYRTGITSDIVDEHVQICPATPEATETPTATPEATGTPTATPEATGTPTATPEATETPTATPEATETPTATPSPTPVPDAVVKGTIVNVREGPGLAYQVIGSIRAGTSLRIVGRNSDTSWLEVEGVANPGVHGWIFRGGLTINVNPSTFPLGKVPPAPASCVNGQYQAPSLVAPEDNTTFENGIRDLPVLQWTSVGSLGPEDYYVITIPHTQGIDEQWSRETQFELPEYLLWLGFPDRKFEWNVRVKHHTGTKANGGMDGVECGDVSISRSFFWRIPDNQRYPSGDYNHDCVVDDGDIQYVLEHWEGDASKILKVLNNWGATCP